MTTYTEPLVSFLVLDFKRPFSARPCLESIRARTKFPHKIIYLHNGAEDYPLTLLKEGLMDELIMPHENGGLGLGTRALYGACFSKYAVYWQVDQVMGRDFEQVELDALIYRLNNEPNGEPVAASISLAGAPCGENIYSERAGIMATTAYKYLEENLPLSHGGAGPYADVIWREEQIQTVYKNEGLIHLTNWPPLAIDNGRDSVRQNPDGSQWLHQPDTKRLWLKKGPVKERFVYPKLSSLEWEMVLKTQSWPPGQIPENEVKDSFHVWN